MCPLLSSTIVTSFCRTMMDTVPLPAEIVARFANKTIAIMGYEANQVFKTAEGETDVPIYW